MFHNSTSPDHLPHPIACLCCLQALVFSQYSNTLDWLKQRLPEEGFGYRTITGSMPLKQRSKAIEVRAQLSLEIEGGC